MESKATEAQKVSKSSSHLKTSAFVGICTGAIGSSIGSGYATLKGHPVGLWTAASGVQCFVLGSTFWYSRGLTIAWLKSRQQRESLSFREEVMCSTVSSSVAGAAGGLLRGRSNVLPAAFVFGIIGIFGQVGASTLAVSDEATRDQRPIFDRLSDSAWWPIKRVPDADYRQELLQQVDAIDAQILTIDDRISALKQERQSLIRQD